MLSVLQLLLEILIVQEKATACLILANVCQLLGAREAQVPLPFVVPGDTLRLTTLLAQLSCHPPISFSILAAQRS